MVLDIVDLLQHQVHYDEFIVLSADADFTPVLRKLRRWDRRTTVLAIGFPSAAYQASADLLIDQDAFLREALRREETETPAAVSAPPMSPAPAQASLIQAAALKFLLLSFHAVSAFPLSAFFWALSVLYRVYHCWPMDNTLLVSQ